MPEPRSKADSIPQMPERVGRYELLLPIASGGMATVYLARSRGLGGFERDVALKLTHAHLRENPEFTGDLLEEAKLAARIKHPNVVPVLDVGDDPLGIFLVMEYVEGDSLAGLLRGARSLGERMPLPIALKILADALSGLHAAHELRDESGELLNVVHRDFSPQNVLIGLDGLARLTDFGVAKAASRLGNTATGLVKGKIAYMAPEQAKGEQLDRRCDIWAAGVLAWELIAARKLYSAENDVATLLKIVTEVPPLLRSVNPDVPESVETAVARALRIDRNGRYSTSSEFVLELRKTCRAHELLADTEDVAAYMERVAGGKVAERRRRTRELLQLRERMGRLASASVEASAVTPELAQPTVSPPHLSPVSLAGDDAPAAAGGLTTPAAAIPRMRASDPDVAAAVTASSSHESERPTALVERAARKPEPRAVLAEQTVTDTTSVTPPRTALGSARRVELGKRRVVPVSIGIAGALALFAGGVVSLSFARQEPVRTLHASVAGAWAGAALERSRTPQDASPMQEAVTLAVDANAPIRALKIGEREARIARPSRTLRVPLESGEATTATRVEATATDGRRTRALLQPGARSITLDFAAPTTTPAPAAVKPPAPGKIPKNPYQKSP